MMCCFRLPQPAVRLRRQPAHVLRCFCDTTTLFGACHRLCCASAACSCVNGVKQLWHKVEPSCPRSATTAASGRFCNQSCTTRQQQQQQQQQQPCVHRPIRSLQATGRSASVVVTVVLIATVAAVVAVAVATPAPSLNASMHTAGRLQ